MNPGVGEEAGKTARGFIDAMKENPALLVLSVSNFVFLLFLLYLQWNNSKAWDQVNTYRVDVGKEVLRYVNDTSRLLAQCSTIPADQMPRPPEIK